ncbi:hypothetical protein PIB30_000703 [Stylosanthes scabra]|uniref:Uncharacterized protein n=1 Tax=Stylosanthes scabra TaxID=79078 RepID=A0ABU6YZA3_9FABA|nr:hypothetical protein [Stylosanthes scabra]
MHNGKLQPSSKPHVISDTRRATLLTRFSPHLCLYQHSAGALFWLQISSAAAAPPMSSLLAHLTFATCVICCRSSVFSTNLFSSILPSLLITVASWQPRAVAFTFGAGSLPTATATKNIADAFCSFNRSEHDFHPDMLVREILEFKPAR